VASHPYLLRSEVSVHVAGATYQVCVVEKSGAHAVNTQDSALVTVIGNTLRIVVLDGVTPTPATKPVKYVDGAIWAAGVARTFFKGSPRGLLDTAIEINAILHEGVYPRSRDHRQVAFVAVDIPLGDRSWYPVSIVRGADTVAWVRDITGWRGVFSDTAMQPSVEEAVNAWIVAHPDASPEERFDMEERLLGRPGSWKSAALGRFSIPQLQEASLNNIAEIIIATDGIKIPENDPRTAVDPDPKINVDGTLVHVTLTNSREELDVKSRQR
jgi:hypothetical protein